MRTMKMTGLIFVLLAAAGILFAQEQTAPKQDVKVKESSPEIRREQPQPRRAGAVDIEQMYRERLAKLTEEHKASLKELEDIKKLAEEEGATKTAEALQKLIAKKDAEFGEKMKKAERMRKENAAQMQEKMKKAESDAPKPADAANDKAATDTAPKK